MKTILLGAASALLAGMIAGAVPAMAADVEVQLLNKGTDGMMVFEPSIVKIAPGDTVHFVPTDKGHNVMSIAGMAPDGATPFQGKMNEEMTVKFDQAGIYGIECKPHYGMGMVGLVVVGEPQNVAEAKAVLQKGKAKQHFEKLFQQLGL
jgi:pseudoazurin